MTKKQLVAGSKRFLEKLPFVHWDRYLDCWKQSKTLIFYGWIDRSRDSYKDFIIINIQPTGFFYITSSKDFDPIITKKLDTGNSQDCKRIEYLWKSLPNVIKLKK